MLPREKVLSSATPCQAAVLARPGGMSNTGWYWAFAVLRIQSSNTHEDAGLSQKGIVFHLPRSNWPKSVSGKLLPLPSHRNTLAGEGDAGDLCSPNLQVKVGSLRWSEPAEVIASPRHVIWSLLHNQMSVNLGCVSWPSGG